MAYAWHGYSGWSGAFRAGRTPPRSLTLASQQPSEQARRGPPSLNATPARLVCHEVSNYGGESVAAGVVLGLTADTAGHVRGRLAVEVEGRVEAAGAPAQGAAFQAVDGGRGNTPRRTRHVDLRAGRLPQTGSRYERRDADANGDCLG